MKLLALLLVLQVAVFDVASIRPGRTDGISEFQIQGRRLSISGMTLKDLVRRAYLGSDAFQDGVRVTGGPAWVASDTFDIVANIDADPGFDEHGRPQRVLAMLRALLEDRFQLKVHSEARETDVYDLQTVSKAKAGLKPSSLDCPVYPQGIPRPAPDPVRWCGVRTMAAGAVVHVTAQGATMADIASSLSRFRSIDRLVHDTTGLSGRFDFEFDFVSAAPATNGTDARPPETGASLFTALQEQLGLKLQPARTPVDVVVIDSAERPRPN